MYIAQPMNLLINLRKYRNLKKVLSFFCAQLRSYILHVPASLLYHKISGEACIFKLVSIFATRIYTKKLALKKSNKAMQQVHQMKTFQ